MVPVSSGSGSSGSNSHDYFYRYYMTMNAAEQAVHDSLLGTTWQGTYLGDTYTIHINTDGTLVKDNYNNGQYERFVVKDRDYDCYLYGDEYGTIFGNYYEVTPFHGTITRVYGADFPSHKVTN